MCDDQDWKTVNEEVKRKGVWTDHSKENQSVKLFVKYMNAHQKASIPEDMDKLHTLWKSLTLSPQPFVFAQWTYMQNAMARERGGMYRPNNMNFLPSPGLTRQQLLLITLPTNSKYQSWATNMTPFSRRKSQLSDHRLIILNSFSQGLSSNLSSL